jgi:hypothetical protein
LERTYAVKLTYYAFFVVVCMAAAVVWAAEQAGPTLLKEDFSVLDPGWGVPSAMQRVEENRLILQPEVSRSYRTLYQGDVYGDIDARVNVSLTQGPDIQTAGLIFWAADGDHYYAAAVTANGRFGVMRMVNGRWLYPVQFQNSDLLKTGLNAVNEIRVVTRSDSATVSVNGKEVVTFKGHPTMPDNMIGLYADSGADACTWKFWDLLVRKPEPVAAAVGGR